MEIQRVTAVATNVVVPLIDASSRPSYRANPTLAAGDVVVVRHTGGAWNVANIGTLPAVIAGATKQVLVVLTATELTSDDLNFPIIVQFIDQTATKEWDDQEIIIWTKPNAVNLIQIDGQATNGNNATLNLKQLNIVNATGDAVIFTASGANGRGMVVTGNGTGNGASFYGGATSGSGCGMYGGGTGAGLWAISGTGATGNGISAVANSTNGHGFASWGNGTGNGMNITGGATGIGLKVVGGATSGAAISATSTSGDALYLYAGGGNGNGINAQGNGVGHGIATAGGATSGSGIYSVGGGIGDGINAQSGAGATGNGINAVSLATNGQGVSATGHGSGNGLLATAGATGAGIRAEVASGGTAGIYVNAVGSIGISVASTNAPAVNISSSASTGIAVSAGGDAVLLTAGGNGNGITCNGAGSGHGISLTKGATGRAMNLSGSLNILETAVGVNAVDIASTNAVGGGSGIYITSASGRGISSIASGGNALYCKSTSDIGVQFESSSAGADDGFRCLSANGNGARFNGKTALYDISAREIQGIKAKTDQFVFTVANRVDATATITGTPDVNVVNWKGSAAPAMTGDAYAVVASGTYGNSAIKTVVDAINAKTTNLPANPAAVGSAMTLAAGAIVAATFGTGAIDANAFAQGAADKVWATTSRAITDKAGFSLSSSQTFNMTGNITGNLSGSVGSVTGNVGGNVAGSVASVVGNVGGNVNGSVASVVGAVGSVTAAVTVGTINTDAISAAAVSAAAVTKIQSGLATASALSTVDGKCDTISAKTSQLVFTGGYVNAQVKAMDTDAISAASVSAGAVTKIQTGLASASAVATIQAKTDQLTFTGGAVDSNVKTMATDAISGAAVSAAAVTKIQNGLALATDMTVINGKLDTIYTTEGEIQNAISVVDSDVQDIVAVLPAGGARISSFALTDVIDGVAVSDIFELTLCMVDGRFKKDYPTLGDVTFFKRDNVTVKAKVHVTETERTRY